MTDFLSDFHFLRPLWLLCLPPAVALLMYLWRVNESGSAWDKAIDRSLLPYLLEKRKSATERAPLLLLAAAWIASIISLAGPVWDRIPQPVQQRQDALVVILDLSLSMYATDLEPNRLTVARRKLLDVLDMRNEGQTGLVVYSADAHAVTPLTEDSVTIRALAPSLTPNIMPAFGSNPVAAVELALTMLSNAGAMTGQLLLITDGIQDSDAAGIRALLQQSRYSFAVLGVGTPEGAPIPATANEFLRDASGQVIVPRLESANIESLVNRLNGRYARAELSSADLDYLLADYDFRNEDSLSDSGESFDIWYDAGPWLLLLVLPIGALVFRRGWVLTLVLAGGAAFSLLPAQPAQAADWKDLWKTRDQQAAEALAREEAQQAAALFETPEWKGSAAYRAGDYDTAIQAFGQSDTVTSLYNLGNAYAMAGLFQQAIESYDRALEQEPDHVDAQHNKAIVEDLLQQQEEQQQQQQDESEEQEQDQEQQEGAQSEPSENNTSPQEQDEQDPDGEPEEQEGEESEEQESQEQQSDQPQQNASSEALEDQESLEQWLRRIDDDPGELLQRKFQYEYRRRQIENRNSGQNRPVERQIW